jgi:hypothetical protein
LRYDIPSPSCHRAGLIPKVTLRYTPFR